MALHCANVVFLQDFRLPTLIFALWTLNYLHCLLLKPEIKPAQSNFFNLQLTGTRWAQQAENEEWKGQMSTLCLVIQIGAKRNTPPEHRRRRGILQVEAECRVTLHRPTLGFPGRILPLRFASVRMTRALVILASELWALGFLRILNVECWILNSFALFILSRNSSSFWPQFYCPLFLWLIVVCHGAFFL